ncbi:hypothetical protein ASG51_02440 [Methylobacterium sp. Leaf465]|nr:hypothetical protein ASG51_02440 [Methylobacterium sp. Leaf465]
MGSSVPVAGVGQTTKDVRHLLKVAGLLFEFLDVGQSEGLHLGAAACGIAPQSQKDPDAFQREAEVPSPADEAEPVHVLRVVVAVAAVPAVGLGHQADALVMADHLG